MSRLEFIDSNGSFRMKDAARFGGLYFPLAGEMGLKSAVTPSLAGDAKTDQNHFLLEPVSTLDLKDSRSSRNFWCVLTAKKAEDASCEEQAASSGSAAGRSGVDSRTEQATSAGSDTNRPESVSGMFAWSATGQSDWQQALKFTPDEERTTLEAGYMWQKVTRDATKLPLRSVIRSFIPYGKNVEIHRIRIENTGEQPVTFYPVAAVPIYGRSADNIRDHRHVTSLLNRIYTTSYGVHTSPTMSFDERGHQAGDTIYFVDGVDEYGRAPEQFFPVQEDFTGEDGTLTNPQAIAERQDGCAAGCSIKGQEALGGLRFSEVTLQPGENTDYILFLGMDRDEEEIARLHEEYKNQQDIEREFERNRQYWLSKVNIHFESGEENFDQYMNWVSFQPELRRLFGCSFLPHHDYGRGGRGWRDLWQDCLALLLMNPDGVRQMLLSNFAGVRVDGTNATIIGTLPGEFKADRNSITRVWMDHGVWPLITTKLYIDQTGDYALLFEKARYFRDAQIMRGKEKDTAFSQEDCWQREADGRVYEASILEHLLIQNLTAFWETGDHNIIRLRDADWNDALDMAGENGESVAFANAYAGNLLSLASLLEQEEIAKRDVELLQDLSILLKRDPALYENTQEKQDLLDVYTRSCADHFTGAQIRMDPKELAANLREKALWLQAHIRRQEWIADGADQGWFNSYYDDHGRPLDGIRDGEKQMMLTGQVFSIMSGTASEGQIRAIVKSADELLYDPGCGGYRLNTDFHEVKMDMGRMFGFAYGEKENGAVFSHMAVMYGYALYSRGFAQEGYKVLDTLYRQSMNLEVSRMYPGIPEYFGRGGKGLYSYLTGAASWYMLTVVLQMYGVRGEGGDLVIEPKLLAEQFDEDHQAALELKFGGRSLRIDFENPQDLTYGQYQIKEVCIDQEKLEISGRSVRISYRGTLSRLEERVQHKLRIVLG